MDKPQANKKKDHAIDRLCRLVQILRGESGCPWDKEQKFEDVPPSIIEEAYELDWASARRSRDEVLEELGDVLFLVCFAIEILREEDKHITIDRIASRTYEKIKRRHPHVFGDKTAATKEESIAHWNLEKEKEKSAASSEKSALSGVPENLSPIKRAEELQRHAAKVGFDWPEATGIIEKLREEIDEIDRCLLDGPREKLIEETGDLFFSVSNLSRFLDINGESSLERANAKFSDRFRKMESLILDDGKRLEEMTLEEMDLYWDRVKARER
jgi:MazG family protein